MHVLPQLRKLEEIFPEELVVLGVHSGKFHAERVTANIRQAVLRLGIEHPVVNDRHFRVWRAYNVSAWPTLVFLDPTGHYIDSHPGEITAEAIQPLLAEFAQRYKAMGWLAPRPIPFRPERAAEPVRPLAFPGKVLAVGSRLFVADTGHHRILVFHLSEDGRKANLTHIVGSGQPGLSDGSFSSASFRNPQGISLAGETLYVADTENHVVRSIDLLQQAVHTIAGTGEQSHLFGFNAGGRGIPLNSPWDVLALDDRVYIAMAGAHQVWVLDPATGEARPLAGNGREDIVDGPPQQASLAQPSGLATDGRHIFVADSESSGIRNIDLQDGNRVRTIVGTGLFDFGHRDGTGDEVRLQHPYGLAWHQGQLYIADTYNNCIRAVDPAARRSATVFGNGDPGLRDGPGEEASFYEPAGITVGQGLLYIADTNNHAIRVADQRAGTVVTLEMEGL